jgi:hypothetical protein
MYLMVSKRSTVNRAIIKIVDLSKNSIFFRMNQVMRRLDKFDYAAAVAGKKKKLPPIINIEPFESDQTGKIFAAFPGHHKYGHEADDGETNTAKLLTSSAFHKLKVIHLLLWIQLKLMSFIKIEIPR